MLFKLQGEKHFLNFSFQCPFLSEISIFRKLLSYRRTAFGNFFRHDICVKRAEKSLRVNAFVFVKSVVLDGNESLLQIYRYLFDFNRHTIFRRVNVCDFISGGIINLGRGGRQNIARQIRFRVYVRRHKSYGDTRRHDDDKNKNPEQKFQKYGKRAALFLFLYRFGRISRRSPVNIIHRKIFFLHINIFYIAGKFYRKKFKSAIKAARKNPLP